jgi:hypothetical protein
MRSEEGQNMIRYAMVVGEDAFLVAAFEMWWDCVYLQTEGTSSHILYNATSLH